MKTVYSLVFVAVVAVVLFLVGQAVWIWITIPPKPDPGSLPSRSLALPVEAYEKEIARGRFLTRSLVAEEKLPGLSLAVAIEGEIVWAEGFGWSHLDDETPVEPEMRFRIGGVSKTLTAAAVGRLRDRGLLDLDAPVRRYLPGVPEMEWPFTTRQLMAHTAGIRAYRGGGGLFQGRSCADEDEWVALAAGEPLRDRPGTESAYSTLGWSLVGAVVASVAGESYLDAVQREVLAPLGMRSTVPDTDRTVSGIAHFYYPRLMLDPRHGLQESPQVDLSCHLPAVGFLSTPTDLVRLGSAMMGDGYLDPATVEELQTPLEPAAEGEAAPALGWEILRVPMGSAIPPSLVAGQGLSAPVVRRPLSATTIGGQVAGGTATLLTVPAHRVVVAVASNVSGAANVREVALRLAEVFVRASDENETPATGTDATRDGKGSN